MSTRKNKKESGEEGYIGEELLEGVSETEENCRAVKLAVDGGYFNLERALKVYHVSLMDYVKFMMMNMLEASDKKKRGRKKNPAEDEVASVVNYAISFSNAFMAANSFDVSEADSFRTHLQEISTVLYH